MDAFGAGCANTEEAWSASQAPPIRRAISVVFQDCCANNNFASGGFIADSQVSDALDFYGNQQYLVRDSAIGGANGCPQGLWNVVYVFFQNELPYDPPNQAAWMASATQDGYLAFLVGRGVRTFHGYGMGSYVVFIQTTATHDAEAFQAP